jgi:uncharacterized membrane protein YagU involved in acid resistance
MAMVSKAGFLVRHPLLTAALAGLCAGVVSGRTDRVLDRLVGAGPKRRDKEVREAPAHQLAGPFFAGKLCRRALTEPEKKRARLAFGVIYGMGWGLIYGALRSRIPLLSRWSGVPFAVPFFFACDGFIAPRIGISPALRRIPWQMNAKEMANHLAWTAAAEAVHRTVARRW